MQFLFLDALEDQHNQAEERANKLKQLLVKAKKDLTDAKKLVGFPFLYMIETFKVNGYT